MVTPRPRGNRSGSRDGSTATTTADATVWSAARRRAVPKPTRPWQPGGGKGGRPNRDPLPALAYLKNSPLLEAAERLIALEDDLNRIQPSLGLKPVRLDKQVLLVTAESAAVAARLRQFEPRLLAGLRARGWLVNRLRFRARVPDGPLAPAAGPAAGARSRIKAPVTEGSLAALETLRAETVARGDDDSPLAVALRGFIDRQRGYRR